MTPQDFDAMLLAAGIKVAVEPKARANPGDPQEFSVKAEPASKITDQIRQVMKEMRNEYIAFKLEKRLNAAMAALRPLEPDQVNTDQYQAWHQGYLRLLYSYEFHVKQCLDAGLDIEAWKREKVAA